MASVTTELETEVVEEPTPEPAPAPAPAANTTVTWVLAGVASVAVLLAAVFGVKAFSKDDAATALNAANTNGVAVSAMGNAGKITQIDGKSFTLQATGFNGNTTNVKVATDGDTTFEDSVDGSLSDLKVGQMIMAMGETADGVLTATQINPADVMRRTNSDGPVMNGNGPMMNGDGPRMFQGTPPAGAIQSGPMQAGGFAVGEITKIEGDTISVTDPAGTANTIKVTSDTDIKVTKKIKLSDLKVGDTVRVGGTSEDGVLKADSVNRGELRGGFFGGPPQMQRSDTQGGANS